MTGRAPAWVRHGRGRTPRVRWTLTADAPLVAAGFAGEHADVQAADSSGGLYRIDRHGKLKRLSRGFGRLRGAAWSADGRRGLVTVGADTVLLLDAHFAVEWSLQIPAEVTATAVAPFGNWLAVALATGETLLVDTSQRTTARHQSPRPLRHLAFATETPLLFGATEHGTIHGFAVAGKTHWQATLLASLGDIAVSGSGAAVYAAAHALGVRILDGAGAGEGTYLVEGTAGRVACSYRPHRVAVATLEHHLYWLDAAGRMLWATAVPEDVCRLDCDPTGEMLLCAFCSGRMVCLEWPPG